ncbi:isochorismatase family cysteine hydrolase [Pseudonocardia sp. GCM10023141]|uniref:isochorismatase family cysteine hydrolase n=1 Tax=Pseudonocardia sp. GCM10023141 TaxID=3252653 RepID=UPI00360A5EE7
MPLDLSTVIAPERTALVLMDLQTVLLGDQERALYGSASVDRLLATTVRLAGAARDAGVPVVHCPKVERPDGRGAAVNAPMWWRSARTGEYRTPAGSPDADIIAALGPEPADLVVPRSRGASIFTGTELDFVLRGLGVTALVVAGISLNVGIVGACIEAISRNYSVVVASDAVAAIPDSYTDVMLTGSIRPTAVVGTSDDVIACWLMHKE